MTTIISNEGAAQAYDDASKCAFDALGVAAVRVHQPRRWSRNRFFVVLKTHPALLALKAGYRVVFSEMDIFWLRDPLDWVRTRNVSRIFRNCSEPADMLVAKHRHGHEANYGFFIANSTDAVLDCVEINTEATSRRWRGAPDI